MHKLVVRLTLMIALGTVALAAPARAQEGGEGTPAAEPSGLDAALAKLDSVFGEWFVGPLAQFLFFDVAFWDNSLPPEKLVGRQTKGGETITGYENGQFQVATPLDVPRHEVTPVLEVGTTLTYGPVTVEVLEAGDVPLAVVKPSAVDVTGFATGALDRWAGPPFKHHDGAALPEGAVVVQHLAPFPVVGTLEGSKLQLEPIEVRVPGGALEVHPGSRVRYQGNTVTVEAVHDGQVTLANPSPKTVPPDQVDSANPTQLKLPFIVLWLVLGAIVFTLKMGFINLRGFWHAIEVTRGQYDDPDDPGEISHFQALSSALSATVGLGNIAGVALAVAAGGPGAVFWMIVAGFLGMSSKFTECTLGQLYREVDDRGVVSGGPMRYLKTGLEEMGAGGFGKVLSVVFALMCIGGSFGGGNMFQANQAFAAVAERIPALQNHAWIFGLLLAVLVGLVIIGGIKRIGAAASFLVPAMCGIYLLAGAWIVLAHAAHIPEALGLIVSRAFDPQAVGGGFLGVLVVGFQRAAFSNEAGVGSASIAHSAASTSEPVREGIVALLEPFIDTIVVCTMTGLVVVITGAYQQQTGDGVLMTSYAFGSVISWFPWVLSVAVLLFAFSTMISWSYYGERCFTLLFGAGSSMPYRIIFCFFVFFGSVFKLGNVLDFSDLMVLGMAFPNILGMYFLVGKVKRSLDDYWGRLKSGSMARR